MNYSRITPITAITLITVWQNLSLSFKIVLDVGFQCTKNSLKTVFLFIVFKCAWTKFAKQLPGFFAQNWLFLVTLNLFEVFYVISGEFWGALWISIKLYSNWHFLGHFFIKKNSYAIKWEKQKFCCNNFDDLFDLIFFCQLNVAMLQFYKYQRCSIHCSIQIQVNGCLSSRFQEFNLCIFT